MKRTRALAIFISLGLTPLVWADAPVVDLSQSASSYQTAEASVVSPAAQRSLTAEERVARLEQQLNNITQMNWPAKIDELQQEVQQLQGQLELEQHNLKLLSDQQRTFYQDLDQRIGQLKTGVPVANLSAEKATDIAKAPAPLPKNSTNTNDQAMYQSAFNTLDSKNYPGAITAFQNYLTTYPKGQYVVNAHYWLGEIYFLQKKVDSASNEFQIIISQYPKDAKVSDAMLKLAFIHDSAGKHTQAKQELQQIVKQYPGTSAAQLATMRLKTM